MPKLICLLTYLICGIAISPEICFGRLGETEEQLQRRYGEPFYQTTKKDEVTPGGEKELHYLKHKEGIVIRAILFQGRSVSEIYEFTGDKQRPLPIEGDLIAKAEAIIEANSEGNAWRRLPAPQLLNPDMLYLWSRADSGARAVVWKDMPNALNVSLMVFVQEVQRAERAAAAGASGF